jgi:Zc3h12a-like Ribonuclease NYN domain
VKPIVLDGSNVSLAGSGGGKLTSLATLAQMVHCLLANSFTPYTIFDASFKHRLNESSAGRLDFNHLTKQLSEYFQMAPAGKEADLFLLELARELDCPVVSNDTFKKYGKMQDNSLHYDGGAIPVYQYQMMAGVVLLPDLKIRRRVWLDERDPANIEAAYASPPPLENVPPKADFQKRPPKPRQNPPADKSAEQTGVTEKELRDIGRVITRFVSARSVGGVQELGRRLQVHRNNYLKRSGLNDKSPLTWFGFAKLSAFLEHHFPEHKFGDKKVEFER